MSENETTETPTISLTDKDHEAIADALFAKGQEAEQNRKQAEAKSESSPTVTTAEVKLTDDDRKGIASYLRQMDKDEAEAAAKDEEEKKRQKQEANENIPQPRVNLFERSMFRIGGGKRASS